MFFRLTATARTTLRRGLLAAVLVSGVPACGVAFAGAARAEVPPKPAARLRLAELGFPGYATSLLHAGGFSMSTVHVLDSSHVLFTYSLRSLVPRLPGDEGDDSARQVAAVVVSVPEGKVVARTVWHLHDHGRYLWSVGNGVFLLRVGSTLSAIAPLTSMAAGSEAFERYPLPHHPGQPVLVQSAPDGKVVMVEMAIEEPVQAHSSDPEDPALHRHKRYVLDFFRMEPGSRTMAALAVVPAGAVASPNPIGLALDGDGYLWAEDGQRGQWTLSFNEFGGKQEKLAPVLSSCRPRLNLLSRSQFLVETCRGTDQTAMLASFGFDGHENWQESFGEALQPPSLSLAPAAGRFAMSRLQASSGGTGVSGVGETDPLSQEIRVYQTESGDLLLRIQCAPAMRSAENFDLSPDGRTLVVLGGETMDVFRLPELSAKDRKELAEAQTMTPPMGNGPVALTRITRPITSEERLEGTLAREPASSAGSLAGKDAAASVGAVAGAAAGGGAGGAAVARVPVATGAAEAGSAAAETAGDVDAAARRKPPTLLKPGERPDFKDQAKAPE